MGTSAIILALLVGAMLGIGGLLLAQQASSGSTPRSGAELSVTPAVSPASSPTTQPAPGDEVPVDPVADAEPAPAAMATPMASPTPEGRPPEVGQPVVGEAAAAEVSHVEVNSAAGGVEVTLLVRNRQTVDLSFPFEPSQSLSLADANGRPYHLTWAEHDGQPKIPAGGEARLVQAYFAGPVDQIPAEGLRLDVRGVPGLENAQFSLRLPQPSAEPLAAGETARGGSLEVSLDSTEVQPEQGSVDVVLSVANVGRADLSFDFSPHHDLALTDADGSGYNLEWAEYAGRVNLTPGQQARLVRAHFRGPVDRLDGKDLRVQVRHLPRIGGATWTVRSQ